MAVDEVLQESQPPLYSHLSHHYFNFGNMVAPHGGAFSSQTGVLSNLHDKTNRIVGIKPLSISN